jgi:secreted Zn-dependent insulinase-like peptidase
VSRQVLHDFWKRWYFPGNATLYLVGDFDGALGGGMDAAEKLIRETFGRIPPGRLPGNGVPGPLKQRQLVSLAAYLQHTTCSLCHTLWPLSQQSGTQPLVCGDMRVEALAPSHGLMITTLQLVLIAALLVSCCLSGSCSQQCITIYCV